MPVLVNTFTNTRLTPAQFPEDARWTAGRFGASLTLAAGTVIGKKTADGLLYAYASGNADGTQVPVGLLMYAINTDASSNVFYQGTVTPTSLNIPLGTAPYFITGTFDTAELTGWDANALTVMKGSTLPSGFIRIP